MGSKWLHEVIAKLTSEEKHHQYEQKPRGQCVGFVVRPSCEYEQVAPGTNAEYQNRKQKIREPPGALVISSAAQVRALRQETPWRRQGRLSQPRAKVREIAWQRKQMRAGK